MLTLKVKGHEFYDERTCEFITVPDAVLQLEHSLLSISKWESKWHKPFLGKEAKTPEQAKDYIRCMTVNAKAVQPSIYLCLTNGDMEKVARYIEDPMTATTFRNDSGLKTGSRHIVTSEELYFSMFNYGIPIECEKWHLNRLMTLIRICSIRNMPSKKMRKQDILAQNAMLNAQRRAASGSKG